ncbi:hypothetical protein ANN_23202 [Periplaneta americana]|uniref:Uncharacterized protein n=1 Tax=Periplaneta americana TaxID=6978 RepID=A0ABQ8SKG4_PERAM|nr:hypothetical protein ANN_23202 [Periplaneta americana]
MAGLCEGGNVPLSFLKAINIQIRKILSRELASGKVPKMLAAFPRWMAIAIRCRRKLREELRNAEFESWKVMPGRGRGVELYSQVPKANAWIFNKSGLSTSEWVTCLKMNANLAAVRGVPGRSLDGSRCRHAARRLKPLPTSKLEDIEVIGLLIGARGVIPKFFESFRKTFELPQTLIADIITSVLKRSCQILSHHIHSV